MITGQLIFWDRGKLLPGTLANPDVSDERHAVQVIGILGMPADAAARFGDKNFQRTITGQDFGDSLALGLYADPALATRLPDGFDRWRADQLLTTRIWRV